jgi:hypothetical protein
LILVGGKIILNRSLWGTVFIVLGYHLLNIRFLVWP